MHLREPRCVDRAQGRRFRFGERLAKSSELQLAVIDVSSPARPLENQSGLQMLRRRIYGAFRAPPGQKRSRPSVDTSDQQLAWRYYLIGPLAERSICCMGLNSHPAATAGTPMNCTFDAGMACNAYAAAELREGVPGRQLRGGAALSAAAYQARAEQLTAARTCPTATRHLRRRPATPMDGLALCAAHGPHSAGANWIDLR